MRIEAPNSWTPSKNGEKPVPDRTGGSGAADLYRGEGSWSCSFTHLGPGPGIGAWRWLCIVRRAAADELSCVAGSERESCPGPATKAAESSGVFEVADGRARREDPGCDMMPEKGPAWAAGGRWWSQSVPSEDCSAGPPLGRGFRDACVHPDPRRMCTSGTLCGVWCVVVVWVVVRSPAGKAVVERPGVLLRSGVMRQWSWWWWWWWCRLAGVSRL